MLKNITKIMNADENQEDKTQTKSFDGASLMDISNSAEIRSHVKGFRWGIRLQYWLLLLREKQATSTTAADGWPDSSIEIISRDFKQASIAWGMKYFENRSEMRELK